MPILGSTGGASVRAFLPVSFKRRLPGWSYGKKIVIPNQQVDANLTNFPVTVYLDSTNFDFSKAKADGSDIRFTDKDYNHLKFERKEHNGKGILVLYDSGDEKAATTGGWERYGYNSGVYQEQATQIYATGVGNAQNTNGFGTTSAINVSGYVTLKAEILLDNMYFINPKYYTWWSFGISTSKFNGTYGSFNPISSYSLNDLSSNIAGQTTTISMDIPVGTTTVYPQFAYQNWGYGGTYGITVKKVWLESTNAVYNVLLPTVSDTVDTEFYMWYGNSAAYNTSIEAWQDQTGKQLTYNGNVKLTPNVGKFAKSGYFNGGANYISAPIASGDFTFGTGDFTIDGWLYPTALSVDQFIWSLGGQTGVKFGVIEMMLYTNGSMSCRATYAEYGSVIADNAVVSYPTLNAWNHWALVRYGSTMTFYLNGKATTIWTGVTGSFSAPSTSFTIGTRTSSTTNYVTGYMDEFRVSKGIARWTSEFIPPTSAYTVDTYTKLLLHFDSSTITDDTGKTLTITGSITAMQSSYVQDARSAYFDGSGDYLSTTAPSLSGSWTYETIINLTNYTSQRVLCHFRDTSYSGVNIWINTSGQLVVDDGANPQPAFSGATVPLNTICHIAVVRNGSTTTGYINGVSVGSHSFTPLTVTNMWIGTYSNNATVSFLGYMAGVRLTVGRARYTANFTPPTSFVIDGTDVVFNTNFDTVYDSNYTAVYHMGSSSLDASGSGANGTYSGTSLTTSEFGSVRSFNGSTDYMPIATNAIPTGNFLTGMFFIKGGSSLPKANCIIESRFTTSTTSRTFNVHLPWSDSNVYFDSGTNGTTYDRINKTAITDAIKDNWRVWHFVKDATAGYLKTFLESNQWDYQTGKTLTNPATAYSVIGSGYATTAPSIDTALGWHGLIGEVRLSKVVRSDAWIDLEYKILKNKVLEFADVDDSLLLSKEYELLGDITVGTATTSISFNNLDIGPEDELLLVIDGVNNTANGENFAIYVNGNFSQSNYNYQYMYANNTTIYAYRFAGYSDFNYISNGKRTYSQLNIKLTNNSYFTVQSNNNMDYNSTSMLLDQRAITSTFTLSSINSLSIYANVTNGIGIGSRFQLYKINGTAVV